MAVFVELSIGDLLHIGTGTTISLERKSGQRVRIRIETNQDVDHQKADEVDSARTFHRSVSGPAPMFKRPRPNDS